MIAAAEVPTAEPLGPALDPGRIRLDFPILQTAVRGKPLVYFDNAATSQKPRAVIEALTRYYQEDNANVRRGLHFLGERATAAYENARAKVRRFLNAADAREIIFVRSTTEAINLVAQTCGRMLLRPGREVLVSVMEHHSNIVPWQMVCGQTGASLRSIPMTDDGELIVEEYERLLSERTGIVAVTHVSNVLGTVNPVGEIVAKAHARGIPVLVDGAQAVGHMKVDVRALDADFYAFSGHKMCGPTGIGVLYGRSRLLEAMPPYQGGGDMIRTVSFESTEYDAAPGKFEAGTPDIAGAVGLGAAVDYLLEIGLDRIEDCERKLLSYAAGRLSEMPEVRILGRARARSAVVSFLVEGVHPHDVGTILDAEGVAVRTGHHCCQPLMRRLGVDVSSRASLAFYNTCSEIDTFADGLVKVRALFG